MKRKTALTRKIGMNAKRNRFGNVAQRSTASDASFPELAGRSFPSKLERDRAVQLVILQRAGELSELRFQPQVHLTRANIGYKPDFVYEENGRTIYEETKGVETEGYRMRIKLWKHYGPALLRVVKRAPRSNRIVLVKEIMPEMDESQDGR